MKRMAANQTAHRQPGALERTVAGDRLESVLGAGRGEAATRRQPGRDSSLVSANEQGERAAGQLERRRHWSPGTENGIAPAEHLGLQRLEAGGVGFAASPDDQVPRRLPLLDLPAPDFPQAPPQTIAGHRAGLESGNDQSHARMARCVVDPDHVEMLGPAAPAGVQAATDVGRPREPVGPREAFRWRQEPPCFDGIETTSCRRPFLRRRDRTARPQRVAMRARKPCLLIRRLLRGRYDGFMRAFLQSEPGNLVMGRVQVKLERADSAPR